MTKELIKDIINKRNRKDKEIEEPDKIEDITKTKNYYSNELNNLLDYLTFNKKNINILGSFKFKSTKYNSDIDLFEPIEIKNIKSFSKKVKDKIKQILNKEDIYLGDIKIGELEELKIIDDTAYINPDDGKIYGYDYNYSIEKLKELNNDKIISDKEYNMAKKLLKPDPNFNDLLLINKNLRFHILRWKPKDILRGYLNYRGYKIKLEDALVSNNMFKIDYIVYLNNKYIEITNIIDIRKDGVRLNKQSLNLEKNVINDIFLYNEKKEYFKVLKRLYTFFNYKYSNNLDKKDSKKMIEKIFNILDSNLGILYQIKGDIEVLIYLLENEKNIKKDRINKQIDNFITRLNNIYKINEYLKKEDKIISLINSILKTNTKNKVKKLYKLKEKIENILNIETFNKVKKL